MRSIEQLIQKYMDGQTTLAEEEQLAKALREDNDPRWEPYRQMLDFIEGGCTGECGKPTAGKQKRRWTSIVRWGAAAAAVVVFGLFILPQQHTTDQSSTIGMTSSGQNEATGQKTTGQKNAGEVENSESTRLVEIKKEASSNLVAVKNANSKKAVGNEASTATMAVENGENTVTVAVEEEASSNLVAVETASSREPVDLTRYIAMVVETEPEWTQGEEVDDSTLIERSIDMQMMLMAQRTQAIEQIADGMQQYDDELFEMITEH